MQKILKFKNKNNEIVAEFTIKTHLSEKELSELMDDVIKCMMDNEAYNLEGIIDALYSVKIVAKKLDLSNITIGKPTIEIK